MFIRSLEVHHRLLCVGQRSLYVHIDTVDKRPLLDYQIIKLLVYC